MSDELKPLCSACGGEGIIRTGITEAPTTNCRDCKGSGFAPAVPIAQDPDAGEREFNAARLRRLVNLLGLGNAVPEGDLLGVMGSVLGMVAREIEELKAKAGPQDANLYRQLRSMHWSDGKLAVIEAKDLKLGVQTYSGEMLDAAIAAQEQEKKE